MPSTFTFPLQFRLTLPYLSQKHLGKQEGEQSFSWTGSLCTMLFLLQSPSSSPATTGTLASARTDQKWGVQPAALRAEMQLGMSRRSGNDRLRYQLWLLQSGPLWAKIKDPWTKKHWLGVPSLDPAEVNGTLPSRLAGVSKKASYLQQQLQEPLKSLQTARSCKKSSHLHPRSTCFPVLIHKPLLHRVSSSVKDVFIMFREGLSLPGKNMH